MAGSISLQKLALTRGGRELFRDLSLVIREGEKVGLIGRNGCGKSSLLRALLPEGDSHRIELDSGEVIQSSGMRLGYLAQHSFDTNSDDNETVEEYLFSRCQSSIDAANVYRALNHCGFIDHSQKISSLSGGWLKRLAFAQLLASEPSFLLLDEPTNHLDVSGLIWL
jgi:ATP-binding cassette subfamily F protein uup